MTRRTAARRASKAAAGAALAAGALALGSSPASAAWPSIPPATTTLPTGLSDTAIHSGFQQISGSIDATEIDWYTFKAPETGSYLMSATTFYSHLDPVMALYDAGGNRLYYNDNRATGDVDSQIEPVLTASARYYVGITNWQGNSTPGAYDWNVLGPSRTK